MSDQGDAQRWRPVSNESGIEPDDPTGPMPAVTGEEPAFPPAGEEQAAWSAETTGGFPATPERAPFEPADPVPAEEQSFSALRRSLAERLARYTEPEGGWPDPPPADTTPPFGTPDIAGSATAEESPAGDPPPKEPPSFGLAEETAHDSADETARGLSFADESAYGSAEETARSLSFADGSSNRSAEETAQRLPLADESLRDSGEKADHKLPFADTASYGSAEKADHGLSFTDTASYGSAEKTAHGLPFADTASYRSAEKTAQEIPIADGSSYGSAEETAQGLPLGDGALRGSGEEAGRGPSFADRAAYGIAEETVQDSSHGLGETGVREPPYAGAEEQDAENEFFGSEDQVWDKVVAPAGPPPQPGKPSSGNMRLPDWMKDGGAPPPGDQEEPRRSRLPLYSGIGVLVLGLLAAGGVAVLKKGGGTPAPVDRAASPTTAATHAPRAPRERTLAQFRGPHTRPAGRITDPRAGLSYPRLGRPWALAPKKSPLSEIGFSMSQFAVTERAAGRPRRWGRLMSAELAGAERSAYRGPGTERAAALAAADLLEARMYAFRHRRRPLASQPLNVGGHKGWLVGYYVTYHRPGVRATAEVFTVAVVDTGRGTPGVLCMTVPNTDRRLWPDVNYVMRTLKVI